MTKNKKSPKKSTTIPKSQIPKTKNTERKALFKGRVNTEAIQDQDSTATFTQHTYTRTHAHTPIHSASTHHVCVCSCVSYRFACWITLNDFLTSAV